MIFLIHLCGRKIIERLEGGHFRLKIFFLIKNTQDDVSLELEFIQNSRKVPEKNRKRGDFLV